MDEAEDAQLRGGVGRRGGRPLGESETLKKGSPRLVHGRRVGLPALIGVVNGTLVPAVANEAFILESIRPLTIESCHCVTPRGRGKARKLWTRRFDGWNGGAGGTVARIAPNMRKFCGFSLPASRPGPSTGAAPVLPS